MTLIDLTNQRFDKLLVLGIDKKNKYNTSGKILWQCQCDCGNIVYKTAESLKRPIKGIKGCSKQCGASIPIGTKFGRLTVLKNNTEKQGNLTCLCKCDCGITVTVSASNLKKGATKSCGCYQKEIQSQMGRQHFQPIDIANQRFGKLVAIKLTEKRQNKSVIWECLCDCGNTHFASVNNLKSGSVCQCNNCTTVSKGENKIKEILNKHKISFETQKTFETCRFPETNALLKFDFYVDNSYLIEFDGIQHYQTDKGWITEEKLLYTQKRDQFKNQWSKENNIPLIRIPYTELSFLDIKDLKINTSKFLIN